MGVYYLRTNSLIEDNLGLGDYLVSGVVVSADCNLRLRIAREYLEYLVVRVSVNVVNDNERSVGRQINVEMSVRKCSYRSFDISSVKSSVTRNVLALRELKLRTDENISRLPVSGTVAETDAIEAVLPCHRNQRHRRFADNCAFDWQ